MASISAIGIIPARYGSSRFPGKPLIDIAGKTMIQRVCEQAEKSKLSRVVVATDDERIQREVTRFGGEVVMTRSNHQSGTDRCNEAFETIGTTADVVVNIQGDEPFIQPEQINKLIACFEREETQIATLVQRISNPETLLDPNRVKAVVNQLSEAIYFSRTALPFQKGIAIEQWLDNHPYYVHIGLYAYRPRVLKEISALEPTALEKAESLEQLRWIDHGIRIQVAETDLSADAIDHPADLERMLKRIKSGDYIY